MKYLHLVPLVALLLLASGCMSGTQTTDTSATGNDATTKTTAAPNVQTEPTTTIAKKATATTEAAPTTTVKAASAASSALGDLAAAISSGVSYKCTYVYKEVQATTWVKGQKFYSESLVEGQTGHTLSDGTWMYIWSDGQPQGTKFNINDMKKLSASQPGAQKPTDPSSIAHEAADVQCMPDLTADSKFTVPSDIEFQDMGELLKNMQNLRGGNIPNLPQ